MVAIEFVGDEMWGVYFLNLKEHIYIYIICI